MNWLKKLGPVVGISVFTIVVIAVVSIVTAVLTYFLWNWLMPDIFELKVITFWQAWGINFLAGLLFKDTSKYNDN